MKTLQIHATDHVSFAFKKNLKVSLITQRTTKKLFIIFLSLIALSFHKIRGCTIVSAIAKNGQVWFANNEDGPRGIGSFINVFPKSEKNKLGYFTFSYLSSQYGNSGFIQGGSNEAGLAFDFNAIPNVEDFDFGDRKGFPQGDDAILPYILGNLKSVDEVIHFFENYWFTNGFRSAQLHVADKSGTLAIISPSGILKSKNSSLISTNFDLIQSNTDSTCWRYDTAAEILDSSRINLETMIAICEKTTQKEGYTMYSNVQNLSTGELWFFSESDPGDIIKTTLPKLLAQGQRSFSLSNLEELTLSSKNNDLMTAQKIRVLTEKQLSQYKGFYENSYIGKINVQSSDSSIKVTLADMILDLFPISENTFLEPNYNISIKFEKDKESNDLKLSVYEDQQWSVTAWKVKQDALSK